MSILKNINNVNVSQNEIITKQSINRNFNKLLDNDKELDKLFSEILSRITQINEYSPVKIYLKNEHIFYKTYINNKLQVFILKSIKNNNSTEPKFEIIDNNVSFINSNWDIVTTKLDNIKEIIINQCKKIITNRLTLEHVYDSNKHTFGEIKNWDDIDKKILRQDFTNIDPKRSNIFFPFKTYSLKQDNVINSGFYRQWDNGLIEYSIVYKLGYIGKEIYKDIQYDSIMCNNLKIEEDSFKYFLNEKDRDIFNKKEDINEFSIFNGMKQNNRNKFVNTYTGKIEFPIPFLNTNYMIFANDIMKQQRNLLENKINSSSNTMIYVNKTKNSIMPLYITFPLDDDPKNSGLIVNTFHCTIIGRWK